MEVQKNKIKIWEKIPPTVMMPLLIFGALGFAIFLIWLGIQLAPVELKDPETLSAEKQQEEWRKKKAGRGNNNDNESNGSSSLDYQYIPKEKTQETGEGFIGENSNANIVENGESNSDEASSTENVNLSDTVDNADENDEEGTNETGKSKSSGGSSASGGTTFTGCTYPTGDINVWWHSASLKQRDCYISKHGVPVFSQEEPYFCDYENSQDCYYMEYK